MGQALGTEEPTGDHDPERTVVIDLDHEHYKRLVIEVANPADVVERLHSAIATALPDTR